MNARLLTLPSHPEGRPRCLGRGRPMSACACAGVPFRDVEGEVFQGVPLDQVLDRTGCGRTCTSCVDDLLRHLQSRLATLATT